MVGRKQKRARRAVAYEKKIAMMREVGSLRPFPQQVLAPQFFRNTVFVCHRKCLKPLDLCGASHVTPAVRIPFPGKKMQKKGSSARNCISLGKKKKQRISLHYVKAFKDVLISSVAIRVS